MSVLKNLCYDGLAIASNDFQPRFPDRVKENAFDRDSTTAWGSLDPPLSDRAWIGYNFLKQKNIMQVKFLQSSGDGAITKLAIEGSNDGNTWEEIEQFTVAKGMNILNVSSSKTFEQIRIMAKSSPINPNWNWTVYEVEMWGYDYQIKYLIKSQNKIHTLSEDKTSLVYPNTQEPLTQANYEKWGMDSLVGYENEISKVVYEMVEDGILEDGRVLRKKINKNEWKINKLEVI